MFAHRLQAGLLLALPLAGCNCDDGLGQLNASVEVRPTTLDFGLVPVLSTKELPLELVNTGSLIVQLPGFSTDAPFIAPTGSSSIATGSSTKIRVGFRPTVLGPVSGSLAIMTSDKDAPVINVPITGTGIEAAVTVEPSVVDFGDVLWVAGSAPERRMVTVSNPGSDSFELTALEIADNGGGVYTLDLGDAKKTYAPGASGRFEVIYTPSGRGASMGSVRITNTTRAAPEITVPIIARGVGPQMEICAHASSVPELCTQNGEMPKVDFGNIPRNGTAQGTVRVLNVGERDLLIAQLFTAGPTAEFGFSPALDSIRNQTVAPNTELMLDISYMPADYAFDAFTLGVASNNGAGSRSLRVQGGVQRPQIRVNPTNVTFSHQGNVQHGQSTVRIFNCGDQPLTITQNVTINQLSGPVPALSIMNAPPANTTIQPQPMCDTGPEGASFIVSFDTTTNGSYVAEVTITSNDPNEMVTVVRIEASKS